MALGFSTGILGIGLHRERTLSKTTNLGLKDIGELATQAGYYTSVDMINDARSVKLFQAEFDVPFTSNNYIFTYDGIIKAGVDFTEITYSVDDATKTVAVKLPEPKILSNEIDHDSFKLLNRQENIFTPLRPDRMNESQAKMKEEMEEKAIANGLLTEARANAETLVRGFLMASYDPSVYSFVFE